MVAKGDLIRSEEYRAWLGRAKGLKGRTLNDVVSRTRRVVKMLGLTSPQALRDVDIRLMRSAELARCSMFVRSQLRRAATLYAEFSGAKK